MTALCYNISSNNTSYPTTPFENKSAGVEENTCTGSGYSYNMQTPNRLTLYLKSGDVLTGSGVYLVNLFINNNSSAIGFKFFNYCPTSTVVTSTSYTIPVGKNARVLHYFLPQTYAPSSISDYPSVNTLTINGAVVQYINNKTAYEYYTYLDSKQNIQITNDYTKKNRGYEPPKPIEHFLKEGDIISGSGVWVAIVSLYDIPT
jgi:hypothetical protein